MKNQVTPNKIIVNVKISLGEQFQVPIKKNATIKKLKQKVKKLRGLPAKCQMFIFEGKQLQNTDVLNYFLPFNQTELPLLLVVSEEETNKAIKQNKEIMENKVFIEKESSLPPFAVQCLPLEFDEVSHSPILKISFEDQHRRVQFSNASYSKLTELCTYFFGVRNPHRMVLCYQDEDSDMIQISSDAELQYALAYHTTTTPNGLKLLKLFFSVRQKKKVDPAVATSAEKELSLEPQPSHKLKDGESLFVTALKDGKLLHLAMSGDQVLCSADPSQHALWAVEIAPKGKEDSEEGASVEVILLSNPQFTTTNNNKSHLRITASGKVDHKGMKGPWARFAVQHLANGQVKLRSVGRSLEHPERAFLGIVKKLDTNEYIAVGDLPEDAPEALLNIQAVSK
jgi:hypothetical protein